MQLPRWPPADVRPEGEVDGVVAVDVGGVAGVVVDVGRRGGGEEERQLEI